MVSEGFSVDDACLGVKGMERVEVKVSLTVSRHAKQGSAEFPISVQIDQNVQVVNGGGRVFEGEFDSGV